MGFHFLGLTIPPNLDGGKSNDIQSDDSQSDHALSPNNPIQFAQVLSTTFVPAPGCDTSWTLSTFKSHSTPFLLQNAIAGDYNLDCFPTGFEGFGLLQNSPIYDPGLCPLGYTTATTFATNLGIETARCCQSGFEYTSNTVHHNQVVIEGCTSVYSGGPTSVPTVGAVANAVDGSTTVTSGIIMWGKAISIAFQEAVSSTQTSALPGPTIGSSSSSSKSSLQSSNSASESASPGGSSSVPGPQRTSPFFMVPLPGSRTLSPISPSTATNVTFLKSTHASDPLTGGTSALSSAPQAITSTNTSLPTTPRKTHSKHLSSGAKAGISIAVLLAIGLLALLAILLLRRRRRNQARENFHMQYPSQSAIANPIPPPRPSKRIPSIPALLIPNTGQLKQNKSWRIPARFPSWRSRDSDRSVGRGQGEMQEAPVSPVSSLSSSSSRGSRGSRGMLNGGTLDTKRNMDAPISPISPMR